MLHFAKIGGLGINKVQYKTSRRIDKYVYTLNIIVEVSGKVLPSFYFYYKLPVGEIHTYLLYSAIK